MNQSHTGFAGLGLSPEVERAVAEAGYTEPTPIQTKAIPYVLQGRDVLGCAQTGTGKTASFTLPMIDILASGRVRARMPRTLILEPTRELAAQVAESFEVYGKYHKLSMALIVGGVSFADQNRKIDRGVDVLIATPGRLLDHFERGKLVMSAVEILVIDEADRMLDMGFIPDVERIVKLLPPARQTLLFSATLFPEVRALADSFLDEPKEISVAPPASPVDAVDQGLIVVAERAKPRALVSLLREREITNALIFCNRKRDVDAVRQALGRQGFDVGALHGDMDQPVRTETLERFKKGEIGILVASDVAARGLDIAALPCVVNYDVPMHAEDYVHRIGRTARAGLRGSAFTLAVPADGPYLAAIAKLIGKEIPEIALGEIGGATLEPAKSRRRGGSRRAGAAKERGARKTGARTTGPRTESKKKPSADGKERSRGGAKTARRHDAETKDGPGAWGGDSPVPAFLTRPVPGGRDKDS